MKDLPPIPMEGTKGNEKLIPGEIYKVKKSVENPELYAIFPYRIYGINKHSYNIALRIFKDRAIKATGGWQQNAIKSALLWLADTAANYVSQNFSTWNENYRFPAMWGPNYDWVPDQDHGAVAIIALQRMILQWDENIVYLLPAWPENWNAEFKLHTPKNTIVTGKIVSGKLEEFDVTPSERMKDIKGL